MHKNLFTKSRPFALSIASVKPDVLVLTLASFFTE